MKILEKIRFGVWAIHPMSAEAYMPLVAALLRGERMEATTEEKKVEAVTYIYEDGTTTRWYSDFASSQRDGVAVYDIQGAITKNDQYCGPSGTVTLMQQMKGMDRNPNILGHILNVDSGGGEATNIAEVARFIRSDIQKPIVAHFNGLMCSAAYGISCATDEIYATLNTDIVGSIGVMMTLADWKTYFEKQGLKIHDIYADQSSNKNGEFYDAIQGNYEPLKTNLLNPFAEQFISLVKTMRPTTAQHEEVFTGKTYLAQDAQANGLIDGIRTYEDSVKRVFEMAKKQPPSGQTPTKNIFQNQKNNSVMKIFGIDFGAVAKSENGDVTMTAEQYAKLEAASTTANANAETISTVTTKVDAMERNMGTLIETVNGLKAWADTTPAAAVAKPKEAPKAETQPDAIQKLNAVFGEMAGLK